MPTSYEKLSALLKELFQLDQADLDFGIYRIMNQKRDEITRFLDHDLLPQVKAAFDQYRPADKKTIEGELQKAIQGAQALGVDPDLVPKVKEIREQLATYAVDTTALENEVYSHLYSFFRRYYDNGDFISMRRYKEGVYAIPYEGEEVKLHWANADQYYVKTTENFRDYAFRLPSGRLAHFKIVEAETEKDNRKAADEKERRFLLAPENPMVVESDTLVMRFEYRADPEKRDQKAINAQAAEAICAAAPTDWSAELRALAPSESNPRRTLLEKHLADYTARNTFDYFIHKDLGGFLRRELDFYIKNEVMRLDDIENENAPRVEQYLSKIKALRQIAHKIIEFLAQIEDFQKKLWLKKKFVVETNYCITLDRVPEALYPEICANDAQREEWVQLFAIDEIKGDMLTPGYSVPLSVEFLKANLFLVLDTKFFDSKLIFSLLASIDNIANSHEGTLVNSDNFHALELLGNYFQQGVKAIYIDPPYNAVATEIIYKNEFKHSSWLALMENRLLSAKKILSDDGIICITIDDYEVHRLRNLLDNIFFEENHLATVPIRNNPSGRSTVSGFAINHEYGLFYANSTNAKVGRLPHTDEQKQRYGEKSENGLPFEWENFRKSSAGSFRKDRPKQFYPFYLNESQGTLRIPELNWDEQERTWNILEEPQYNETVIWPYDDAGQQRVWNWGVQRSRENIADFRIDSSGGRKQLYKKKYINQEGTLPRTWWDSPSYSARDNGTRSLVELFGPSKLFDFPKSIDAVKNAILVLSSDNGDVVLDFFAGSGTTGHAVIELNRENADIQRKYILVEMGDHFHTVTKHRILKAIYSKDWRNGKPISREGSSHCVKYLRLESYEDTLNNLALCRGAEQQLALDQSPDFRESYLLSYMLDAESRGSLLNIQSFVHPFDYQLNIATGAVGESKPTKIDLVETFNYLIGLRVQTLQTIRGFRVVTGLTPAGDRTLIIWRDLEENDNAALEAFFRKQDYNTRDMEFDLIYVNGDNNLENLRRPDETWKVRLIEEDFLRLMFEES